LKTPPIRPIDTLRAVGVAPSAVRLLSRRVRAHWLVRSGSELAVLRRYGEESDARDRVGGRRRRAPWPPPAGQRRGYIALLMDLPSLSVLRTLHEFIDHQTSEAAGDASGRAALAFRSYCPSSGYA
jgi:hypothetical protein